MENLVELTKEELIDIDGGWGGVCWSALQGLLSSQIIQTAGEIIGNIDWEAAGNSLEASGFAHQGANK